MWLVGNEPVAPGAIMVAFRINTLGVDFDFVLMLGKVQLPKRERNDFQD